MISRIPLPVSFQPNAQNHFNLVKRKYEWNNSRNYDTLAFFINIELRELAASALPVAQHEATIQRSRINITMTKLSKKSVKKTTLTDVHFFYTFPDNEYDSANFDTSWLGVLVRQLCPLSFFDMPLGIKPQLFKKCQSIWFVIPYSKPDFSKFGWPSLLIIYLPMRNILRTPSHPKFCGNYPFLIIVKMTLPK